MTLLQAIFLAVVQGVTEFLPISSSGHLAIFKNIFGMNMETGALYDVLLHFGTLVAIFVVYRKDVKELIIEGIAILGVWIQNGICFLKNIFAKEKKPYQPVVTKPYRRFVIMVLVSTIITSIFVVFDDLFESFGETLLVPGICLIITALILQIADRVKVGTKTAKNIKYRDAWAVGLVQGIATLPGISRSGSTITAGLCCGFKKEFALKYSFIMSIPAILGAVVIKLLKYHDEMMHVGGTEILYYVIGTVTSAVVGYICIKTLLVIVRKYKFTVFSIYCLIVGVVSVLYHFIH